MPLRMARKGRRGTEVKDRDMEYPYFPVFIDLSGKKVVVIGAGRIAARRIRTLLDFGPDITVVAPEISGELRQEETVGRLCIRERKFREEDLDGAALVLTATGDDSLNTLVCRLCRERHIPVNNAGNQADCDFFFPGIARRGDLVAGVTASGRDHRKARLATEAIREVLREREELAWNADESER